MALGIVALIGVITALIGVAANTGYMIGLGVFIAIIGFVMTTGTLISIPWYVWVAIILGFILWKIK